MHTLAFFPSFSGWELLIIAGIALLIFGKRLPDVGRSLGKGIVEFKKGLKGIEEDVEEQSNRPRRDLPASANRAPLPEADDRRVVHDVRADRPEEYREAAPREGYEQREH
jgi:sec-independent protein translocase protein TatA